VLAVLRQRRAVADQSGLNSRERLENLAGALELVPGGAGLLREGPVVLVDDLMTTGASLREAARAVRAASVAGSGGHDRPRDVAHGEEASVVYGSGTRERTGARTAGPKARTAGPKEGEVTFAAVIAATPDSFGINRN
jgi:hypothetical protein